MWSLFVMKELAEEKREPPLAEEVIGDTPVEESSPVLESPAELTSGFYEMSSVVFDQNRPASPRSLVLLSVCVLTQKGTHSQSRRSLEHLEWACMLL